MRIVMLQAIINDLVANCATHRQRIEYLQQQTDPLETGISESRVYLRSFVVNNRPGCSDVVAHTNVTLNCVRQGFALLMSERGLALCFVPPRTAHCIHYAKAPQFGRTPEILLLLWRCRC